MCVMKRREQVQMHVYLRVRGRVALALVLSTRAARAQHGLRVSGNQSGDGVRTLRPGFAVRPVWMRLGPERTVDVASLRLGPECVGFVTLVPDDIVHTNARIPLRFTVRSEGDTMLIVNTPDGRWRCDAGSDGHAPRLDADDGAERHRRWGAVWPGCRCARCLWSLRPGPCS